MDMVNILNDTVRRAAVVGLLSITAALGLAACGGDSATGAGAGANTGNATPEATATTAATAATPTAGTGASSGGSTGSSNATTVKVKLTEWAVAPETKELTAGDIRFEAVNEGKVAHNLTVSDASGEVKKTPNFRSDDGSKELEVNLKPGTYTLLCDIPGHPEAGMKTEIIVK